MWPRYAGKHVMLKLCMQASINDCNCALDHHILHCARCHAVDGVSESAAVQSAYYKRQSAHYNQAISRSYPGVRA